MLELGTKTARMGSVDQRPAQRDTNWGNKMLTKCLEEKIYERAEEKNETRGRGDPPSRIRGDRAEPV